MDQKTYIGHKIKELRNSHVPKMTADKLGSLLDPPLSGKTIISYESGRTQPNADTLIQMCVIFGVPISEFYCKSEEYVNSVESNVYIDLPIYGEIAAGTPIEMLEIDAVNPCPIQVLNPNHKYGWLRVVGNSYTKGGIYDGMLALVDFDEIEPVANKPFAVCVNGYSATIKSVQRLENGIELIPNSYDPTFKPIIFDYTLDDTEEVTIIGRVVWASYPVDYRF